MPCPFMAEVSPPTQVPATVRSPDGAARLSLPSSLTGREAKLVGEAIASNWIAPLGPQVDAFERELATVAGVEHAVALSSGTAALHLALVVLGIGAGDEVACSDLTFAASANAVAYTGATPFFVDCDAATWTLDPELLDRALTERRAARGERARPCRRRPLRPVLRLRRRPRGVRAARRRCSSRTPPSRSARPTAARPPARQGILAAFSFNGNKIITTSGGGMLVSRRRAIWSSTPASSRRRPASRSPHYEHTEVGFNYRLSNVLAALGRAQLEELADRVETRRRIRERYRELLGGPPGVTFMPEAAYGDGNAWLTCIVVDPGAFGADREAIRLALEAEDIEARPLWKPMHLQPNYAAHGSFGGDVSARLFERGLCLPSGRRSRTPIRIGSSRPCSRAVARGCPADAAP